MKRLSLILLLIPTLSLSLMAQQGPPPPRHPPGGPPPPGMMPPPHGGLVLWPAGARVEQLFELQGEELERELQAYPGLQDVESIRVIDYSVPGPPAPPGDILEFYDRVLREPAWRAFFKSTRGGPDAAAVAYRGPDGFISVLARPRGATVTHIKGEVQLSDMPTLERVVREAVAKRERMPLEARDAVHRAVQLERVGKPDEAVQSLRSIISEHPYADAAHFHLARILAATGNPEEAGAHFRSAIGFAPLNALYRSEYARFLQAGGDNVNAEYELQQSATIDPWSPSVQMELARILENKGMLKDAERHIRRSIELTGSSPDTYMDLGRILEKQGRPKDALAAYRDALKLKSDFAPAREAVRRLERVSDER